MLLLSLLIACVEPEVPTYDTRDLAVGVADLGLERWPAAEAPFDWIPTVWAYGLHRLHARTNEPAYQDWYATWVEAELHRFVGEGPGPMHSSDSLSPALLASTLMLEDGSTDYAAVTSAAAAYLASAPRTQQGAIEHWSERSTFGVPDQVWIDSQFMFGLYLLREHERTGASLDLFREQYLLFSDLCRDPNDQLYRHAYDDTTGQNIPVEAAYWARGNAWVLVSAAEYLALVPEDDTVLDAFQQHAAAVIALQAADGLWHTVLNAPRGDDPQNYTETSASALIAFALARGLQAGVLDEAAAGALDAAVTGIRGRIDADTDGTLVVEGTSYGTNPGDYDYYVGIGTRDDLMLGVGSVVMLLAEVHGMEAAP